MQRTQGILHASVQDGSEAHPLSPPFLTPPRQVDMGALKCALVLCDTLWRDPGAAAAADAESSGCEHLAAEDYLRLDAMILVTQLNIRTALDVRAHPLALLSLNLGFKILAAGNHLRLDAMILVTQLNIRTALDVRAPPLHFLKPAATTFALDKRYHTLQTRRDSPNRGVALKALSSF